MIAMAESKKGGVVPASITPEQDDLARIAFAFLRTRGWNVAQIGREIGYASGSASVMLYRWQRGDRPISGPKADALIALANKIENEASKPPTPPRDISDIRRDVSARGERTPTTREAIEAVRADLSRAHGRLTAAAERALPLMRPGLLQAAQQLERFARDLEIG